MDVVISHVDLKATASLLRNDCINGNHWLGITLEGKNGPASAIAAKVIVTAGGKKQVHVNQWTTGYLCNNDPRVHIGLGKATVAQQIEVFWNNGKHEVYNNIAADRYIVIKEGEGVSGKR
jgi:hypothetical protein